MRKVALITGGTRGIGHGISHHLAQDGYDLALCGRRTVEEVQSVVAHLSDLGARVLYFQADVADRAARGELVAAVRSEFGRLHLLVNNAGVAPKERKDILEASEESFRWVLQVNLQGPYFLTQTVANWMIEQKAQSDEYEASIINISSVSATLASTNRGEYCISKAAISMATQLWAVRLAEFNIPVHEVRPGLIRTDMTAKVKDKYDRLIEQGLLLEPRWGTPDDVGRVVSTLAGGRLSYSTGQVIMVDGGMTVGRL